MTLAPAPSAARRRLRPIDAVLGVLALGGILALGAWRGWFAEVGVGVLGLAVAAALGPALARIDLAERRLPNALTLPIVGASGAACVVALTRGAWQGPALALAAIALLLVLWLVGGMGAGDLKLGAGLALAVAPLAWWLPLASLAAAFVVGGLVGIVSRIRGEHALAFGPWLLVGAAVAVAFVGA